MDIDDYQRNTPLVTTMKFKHKKFFKARLMTLAKRLTYKTSTRLTRKTTRKKIIIIYTATITRFSCVRKNFWLEKDSHDDNKDIKTM